jgi:hypothetical protein
MSGIIKKYEEVIESIIRPYREIYTINDLGPDLFTISDKTFTRRDFVLLNKRNLKIQCSFYSQSIPCILPCVIYMHTHNSSRLEALPILPVLLPSNINVFTFDFCGCGLSEGDFVSLGWFEKEDLKTVIEFIRNEGKASCVGLWGKGMGAVTALLYADQDPCIGGMVLDSPFLSLNLIAEQELEKRKNIPGFIKSAAISHIRKSILSRAKFDVNDINTIEHVSQTFIPCIFCRGQNDDFIPEVHLSTLFSAYPGDKKQVVFSGNHNSKRPSFFLDSVAIFFFNILQCSESDLPAGLAEEQKANSDDSYELL